MLTSTLTRSAPHHAGAWRHTPLLVALAIGLLALLPSCKSISEDGAPVLMHAEVLGVDGSIVADVRYDGRRTFIHAFATVTAELLERQQGIPVYQDSVAEGRTVVRDRGRDYREEFGPNDLLPSWVADELFFAYELDVDAATGAVSHPGMGLRFAPEAPPPVPVADEPVTPASDQPVASK